MLKRLLYVILMIIYFPIVLCIIITTYVVEVPIMLIIWIIVGKTKIKYIPEIEETIWKLHDNIKLKLCGK